MEAVPRLPMVCFELRTPTESTSFGPRLKEYIQEFYNEDPEAYNQEIAQLEALRASAVRPGRDVSGVATMKRYYCQLHNLRSRFPMVTDAVASVPFHWRDVYLGMSFTVADIRFEMSSILYNIGALHTQLGMSDTRTTEDGMKMACTHFQCAAWCFQHIKDAYPAYSEGDVAPHMMQFAYHLCLAQAQECILEKSMMDNRKASIIVKVAVQVVNYYSQAFNALRQSSLEDAVAIKIYAGWQKLAKFKEIYYRCVIQLFQGMQAEEQQKMGERVAFYQLAHDTLEEAIKLSKNLDKTEINPKQVQEALSFTQDVVEGKRKAAKNENEYIYHEEVPDRDQLPKAMGVSLVKGIPFSFGDPEVSGPDIFGKLVPMKVHESSSLYSEEKAKLLRKVGCTIEEKDQLLTAFLSSLQLDYLHCYSEPNQLPQELVDRCAALSAKPNAIQNLVDSMSKLSDVCSEVETMLREIKSLLEEEGTQEREYQTIMGKRPPSIVATDLTREATKYQEAHSKANESNQALHKVMSTHINNLLILSLPLTQLQQQIPPPPTLSDPESESIVKEMQGLMDKVEEMRSQRAMLTSQLRESICKDDITQHLVVHQHMSLETTFEDQLKKHEDVVKLIQQNLSAQDNILKAVTDAYARYSNVRKATAEAVRKRQSVINALISCFDAYEDLLAKSSKGHEFYNILETNVSKLLGRVKSTCRVQQEEREQMLLKSSAALPSKIQNKSTHALDSFGHQAKVHATPKLKDYLQSDGGVNLSLRGGNNYLSSDVASAAYSGPVLYSPLPPAASTPASSFYDSTSTINSAVTKVTAGGKPESWMPGVRPAPLGSEATTSVFKSEPNDMKSMPYPSQTHNIPQSSYPQVYNYAGTWGYGSQAATMSTYLPADVNYSVDSKPSELSTLHSSYQPHTFTPDQGQRYTPVGSISYQSGSNEVASVYPASQSNNQYMHESLKNVPSQVTSPITHVPENGVTANSYQPQPTYDSYTPNVVTPGVQQYHHQSSTATYQNATASSYQNPQFYNTNSAVSAAPYQNVGSFIGHSDPIGSSGYNSISVGAQSYETNSYPNQLSQTATYDQQVQPNYQGFNNPAVTHASQSTVYAYDPQYQGHWPTAGQSQAAVHSSFGSHHMVAATATQQYQYMSNQNISSYSSAGSYPTSQTSSSYSPHIQNYGYDSNAASAEGNYYQVPPYGTQNHDTTESSVESKGSNEQDYSSHGMYMQARMPNSDSYTTNSPQSSRSSFTESTSSSNIDLLAGLDFSINQQPLIPQQRKSSFLAPQDSASQSNPLVVSAALSDIGEAEKVGTGNQNTPSDITDPLVDSMSSLKLPEEQVLKPSSQKLPVIDPFKDKDYLLQFTQEVEKYEKFVEGITLKTLNGPTPLDMKWKEINELQERDSHQRSISVARCYPMKNRFPDILPYDCSRVELPSTKDDYINASYMKNLTPATPPFILTQSPLPSTYNDFWIMIHEQQVEVIVCLLSDMELEGQKYWPAEKNQELSLGRMRLNLQTANMKQHWTERIISVYDVETRLSRIVVHLQFTSWPGSSFPASPGPFLSFVTECLAFHSQQRVASHPVVVHCLSGVGRTGLFCLTAAAVCEVQAGHGLIDLVKLTAAMSERRKAALRDREHLKFAYLSLLYYAQDILMKCGILTSGSSFEDKKSRAEGKCHTRHPSQDFLLGPPTGLSQLQSGIEKMGLGPAPDLSNDGAVADKTESNKEESIPVSLEGPSLSYTCSPEKSNFDKRGSSSLTDLSQLTKPNISKDMKSPRFSAESFKSSGQGQLVKPNMNPNDPFSGIDPLWPLKRS